jgi:beta-glucosidase
MIRPLLISLFKAGVYDRPQIDPSAEIHTPRHLAIAQKAAESAVVLLKNEDRLLPLEGNEIERIVVMGRAAVKTTTGGGGSSYIHRREAIDILTGVKAAFPDCRVDHIPFRKDHLNEQERDLIQGADVVVLAAGFYAWEESEAYDRAWALPEKQSELIQKVSAINAKTIVVLSVGGGLETESWVHTVPALLHTFYLGEMAGTVIARVLAGEKNPEGKLPFTMAKHWEDFESTKYYVDRPETVKLKQIRGGQGNPNKRKVWQMRYGEGLRIGYRHFDTANIEPQFAFGHGLSYTSFELSKLEVSLEEEKVEISIEVKNSGERPGAEVVQVYVRDVEASVFRPEKELKAFQKVYLRAGESKSISITLGQEAFAFYDVNIHDWKVEPGEFEVLVGTSSREIAFRRIVVR